MGDLTVVAHLLSRPSDPAFDRLLRFCPPTSRDGGQRARAAVPPTQIFRLASLPALRLGRLYAAHVLPGERG